MFLGIKLVLRVSFAHVEQAEEQKLHPRGKIQHAYYNMSSLVIIIEKRLYINGLPKLKGRKSSQSYSATWWQAVSFKIVYLSLYLKRDSRTAKSYTPCSF